MTTAPPRITVADLASDVFLGRLAEALNVYVTAMGYPRATVRQRAPLWREHVRRPGWRAMGAIDRHDRLIGLAYGYLGASGQWWHDEVRRGLSIVDRDELGWLTGYFELTELHVLPEAQGAGLGEQLLRMLLTGCPARSVLLSTPELDPRRPARAWRLYRRLGFVDVLRSHHFIGDPRPFAVLGRPLPLRSTQDAPEARRGS
ncbi:MAG: GNAT family N-acetyltransferase [Pseudonocardiales bacterium]|nr:GNAT family N-acetyltransferase [Pseudonocardiales bacterium]